MGRYKKSKGIESSLPFGLGPTMKRVRLTDTKTGRKTEGLDWDSYKKAEHKAWKKALKRAGIFT